MFEWDENKRNENYRKHSLDFEDSALVFEGHCITYRDTRFDYGEDRFISIGLLADRVVVIAHTQRGEKTRIISMRKGNDREQKYYQERSKTN